LYPAAAQTVALATGGDPVMTNKEKILRGIGTLRALIELDLDKLHGKTLPAEQRQVIKKHLDMLISDMQTLFERLECNPSGAENPSAKCNPNDLDPPPRPPAGTRVEFDKDGWRH
jgi:hypothetical protein